MIEQCNPYAIAAFSALFVLTALEVFFLKRRYRQIIAALKSREASALSDAPREP